MLDTVYDALMVMTGVVAASHHHFTSGAVLMLPCAPFCADAGFGLVSC